MDSIRDLMQSVLGDDALRQMGERTGADPQATQKAVQVGIPVLLEMLRKNASKPGGAEDLLGAVERDHDGSVLESVGDIFSGARDDDGRGILRHILGDQEEQASEAVGQFAGLPKGKALQLLIMLAPMIMGWLGKMKQRGQVQQPRQLPEILGREGQQSQQGLPDLGGVLGDILRGGGGQQQGGGYGQPAPQAQQAPGCLSMLMGLLGGRK